MKRDIFKPIYSISYRFLFFLLGSMLLLSSCEKEEDGEPIKESAPPVIQGIRVPTKADSTFTKSTLGTTIVIMGDNLAGTQEVYFNGYKAPVNPAYATKQNLIIRIPDEVPTVATNPDVPNELKIVNSAGETTYEFQVLPPAPVVSSISNDWAKAGEKITLYGSYFYFVQDVVFPGKVSATEYTASPDGTTLTVTVPEGVNYNDPANAELRVETQSGLSAVNNRLKFNDRNGMMVDWDTRVTYSPFGPLNSTWGISEDMSKVTDAFQGIAPVDGKYGLVNMPILGNWSWANAKLVNLGNNDASFNGGKLFPTTPAELYDPAASLANFELRVEIAATQPVGDLLLQVWQSNSGKDFDTAVPLKDFVKSADGKWYTVAVNLGNLAADKGATKMAKYGDFTKATELRVLIQNPTAATIPTTLAIDNIRIVNINK
ncbi:glycan-binding surface protein [Pontibacter liquoris]|uniref:glycan-binding surface protein n=1 Tax=Pontibacter liquoris TaxID=2905677 RepID=UPI001FA731FB|nr:glycan-binding surface protein [Pontibacter liquoris]